jgi:hypothetical protein
LVEQFVQVVGAGVMRRLLLDLSLSGRGGHWPMQAALKASMSSSPCARIWPFMRMPWAFWPFPRSAFRPLSPRPKSFPHRPASNRSAFANGKRPGKRPSKSKRSGLGSLPQRRSCSVRRWPGSGVDDALFQLSSTPECGH